MAVEKGKVKAALDTLFKGKSVSKELKEKYAARWANKIDTDDDIDDFVKDREDDVLDASKEADARATQAAQTARQEAAAAAAGKEPEKVDNPVPNDAPDWFKAYMAKDAEEKAALKQQLGAFEQKQQAKSIAERFKTDERLKGVPEFMMKGYIPQSEEEFENSVTALSTEFGTWAKDNKLSSFGADSPSGRGNDKTGSDKPDSVVADFAKSQNEKFLNTQKN